MSDDPLSLALADFQAGRLSEAADRCGTILEADPRAARAWHLLGLVLHAAGYPRNAIQMLAKAVEVDPGLAAAHNDLANVLLSMGRIDEAMDAYRRALGIAPEYPEALNNFGNACQMKGEIAEAIECYRRAVSLRPGYAEAHRNLGSALRKAGRTEEALAAFEEAVRIAPDFADALCLLVRMRQELCAWDGLAALSERVIRIVESGAACVNPFLFLCLDSKPAQQLACARKWSAERLPAIAERPSRRIHDRIRLGYLSADYQEHATVHLIGELFRLHDRERFEVIGYSYGRDDGSAARRRVAESFDHFVDLENAPFPEAAARIREDGIDILIDLKGYTTDARPEILALRPAPVQVAYLGYPGTMGTEAVDYVLADRYVIPPEQEACHSERVIYLPDCYQVNDRTRRTAERVPSRAECGLPDNGVVFCCFSAPHKITPAMFDVWMRLLASVDGSVLWLLECSAAEPNLRREASARGVDEGRLVFAPSLPNPEHLARFALADFFLDTLPYNAHTLGSDALWGGCPMVTCSGETFASRVGGSLLRAVGLPELVTETLQDYEAVALRIARNAEYRAALRSWLYENRLRAPLFDSVRFTRNLEEIYARIAVADLA